MRFEIAAQSIKGGRSYQEDTWTLHALNGTELTASAASPRGTLSADGALVVVADGMGGEGGGAEASRLVADRFTSAFFADTVSKLPQQERLRTALDQANAGLLAAKQRRSELKEKSGSTLIAGILRNKTLDFLSVGDSSIWRFREDEVHRINLTHERAAEMDVRAAELDTDDAWDIVLNDVQRQSITAAVMGFPLEAQQRQIACRTIQVGDVLVFASDGIETLSLEHLRRAVSTILAKRDAPALASALVKMIERLGGRDQDNTTVVVVRALPDDLAQTRMLPQTSNGSSGASAATMISPTPASTSGPWGPVRRVGGVRLQTAMVMLALVSLAVAAAAVTVGRPFWSGDRKDVPRAASSEPSPTTPTSLSGQNRPDQREAFGPATNTRATTGNEQKAPKQAPTNDLRVGDQMPCHEDQDVNSVEQNKSSYYKRGPGGIPSQRAGPEGTNSGCKNGQ